MGIRAWRQDRREVRYLVVANIDVATRVAGTINRALANAADEQLYEAKGRGRNRFCAGFMPA